MHKHIGDNRRKLKNPVKALQISGRKWGERKYAGLKPSAQSKYAFISSRQ